MGQEFLPPIEIHLVSGKGVAPFIQTSVQAPTCQPLNVAASFSATDNGVIYKEGDNIVECTIQGPGPYPLIGINKNTIKRSIAKSLEYDSENLNTACVVANRLSPKLSVNISVRVSKQVGNAEIDGTMLFCESAGSEDTYEAIMNESVTVSKMDNQLRALQEARLKALAHSIELVLDAIIDTTAFNCASVILHFRIVRFLDYDSLLCTMLNSMILMLSKAQIPLIGSPAASYCMLSVRNGKSEYLLSPVARDESDNSTTICTICYLPENNELLYLSAVGPHWTEPYRSNLLSFLMSACVKLGSQLLDLASASI